ncbi:hypothetical protein SSX86_032492 [Deinandra increscens subsp. villosa]|uniref:PGG domain-containing protein n=1 Tax=Deinandra increscens subsp. villosa TaxID=3103831 RepID=A0AAP0C4W6_9ASTR
MAHSIFSFGSKILETIYASSSNEVSSTFVMATEYGEYLELCRDIQTGDWKKAEEFFIRDEGALTCALSLLGYTALHLAIANPVSDVFIKNLLDKIHPELLPKLLNKEQQSPLHCAAILDNHLAAEMLVEKNPHLLFTVETNQYTPVLLAVVNSNENTFRYLLKKSKEHVALSQEEGYRNPFEGEKGVLLLDQTILMGHLDDAYELLKEYPTLARTKFDTVQSPLWCLANMKNMYPSARRYNFYQRFVYTHVPTENCLHHANKIDDIESQETYRTSNPVIKSTKSYCCVYPDNCSFSFYHSSPVPHIKDLHADKVKHNSALKLLKFTCEEVGKLKSDQFKHYSSAFLVAATNNIPEVVDQITKTFPHSFWVYDAKGYRLSQLSIMNRCENVYNLLVYGVTYDKHLYNVLTDTDKNNLLHLAGQLAPTHKLNQVTGAALRMQRELQWFQEVEKLMRPKEKEALNRLEETPMMVFRREHKDLRQEGEEWMKKTADSYTITAALIITIVFAAAITVPGGNNGDTGIPIYRTSPSFIIFAISDAISLFTSTTSLLLFLSILTARFADEDFLYKLPKRLVLGLVMLFMSLTGMMIAFSATLYIMFGLENSWVLIPIALLTCLPIASFVTLQLPLLVDLIASTYGSGIFGKRMRAYKDNIDHKRT